MKAMVRLLAWTLAVALVALPVVAVVNGWVGGAQWPLRTLRVQGDLQRVDEARLRATVLPHARRGFFAVELDRIQAAVLAVVQPEQVRFRARALQGDLARLRDGLPVRIAAPSADALAPGGAISGSLQLAALADADGRTIDLIVTPSSTAGWTRAGVAASLEVTLEGGATELAIPVSAVVRDGATPIVFRRDPKNPDKVIRLEADLGLDDGRWIEIKSGVREGDEIVLAGNYQLLLATSGSAPKGGHFHSDGTFHAEDH